MTKEHTITINQNCAIHKQKTLYHVTYRGKQISKKVHNTAYGALIELINHIDSQLAKKEEDLNLIVNKIEVIK